MIEGLRGKLFPLIGTSWQSFQRVESGGLPHITLKMLELAREKGVDEEIIDYFAQDAIKKFKKYAKDEIPDDVSVSDKNGFVDGHSWAGRMKPETEYNIFIKENDEN